MKEIKETIYSFAFEDVLKKNIYLLSKDSALKVWEDNIDKINRHYFKLSNDNWLISNPKNIVGDNYIEDFNNESSNRIGFLLEKLKWDGNDEIFFCLNSDLIISTNWSVFKKYWINFLYVYDDNPIILNINGNDKKALVFEGNGIIYQITK